VTFMSQDKSRSMLRKVVLVFAVIVGGVVGAGGAWVFHFIMPMLSF
jgi:LPS O-antigen subunit length determinant protein (WzzB/FepE family)